MSSRSARASPISPCPNRSTAFFSNAVFHWIPDDAALFRCLAAVTKAGGRLRAQCGGYGNNARVLEAVATVREDERFAPYLRGFTDSKTYRTPEDAKAALERAGWRDVRAALFAEPVPFEREDDAALYVQTILLRDHVERLPETERDAYARGVVRETIRRHGEPYVADYVRLNLSAVR